ncbi:hypothetical protein IFM46972_09040 [Aspergillus udagawae]|uniref:Uncharacterized protein n=1 Tax=Aspergillus udagawae TaxID=91492 RepID=A0A8H3PC22_9EURO|nr:hypothetical protein IFM46972_09040 [Aspergillus udagawae]
MEEDLIRDRQISSGTGKPMMVDERDCDVEELTTEDFVDGESIKTAYFTISLVRIARITFQAAGRISDYAKEILEYFTVNEFPIYA